jgi:hypothetical protein
MEEAFQITRRHPRQGQKNRNSRGIREAAASPYRQFHHVVVIKHNISMNIKSRQQAQNNQQRQSYTNRP